MWDTSPPGSAPHAGVVNAPATAKTSRKTFILDTNVLLHDPQSIFRFEEHEVVIPIKVIEEVDRFKRDPTEIGRSARRVSRYIDGMRERGSGLADGVLDRGGILRVSVGIGTSRGSPRA
ncbi:MAG: PIN domain-containing protein [Acidobacteriota bacterium]